MKLSVEEINNYVYCVGGFHSCRATPNNEAPKTTYVHCFMFTCNGSCERMFDLFYTY